MSCLAAGSTKSPPKDLHKLALTLDAADLRCVRGERVERIWCRAPVRASSTRRPRRLQGPDPARLWSRSRPWSWPRLRSRPRTRPRQWVLAHGTLHEYLRVASEVPRPSRGSVRKWPKEGGGSRSASPPAGRNRTRAGLRSALQRPATRRRRCPKPSSKGSDLWQLAGAAALARAPGDPDHLEAALRHDLAGRHAGQTEPHWVIGLQLPPQGQCRPLTISPLRHPLTPRAWSRLPSPCLC